MELKNCARSLRPLSSYASHVHSNWFEIIYQYKGNVTLTADQKSYTVKQGDVIILPPNTPHSGDGEGGFFEDVYVQGTGGEFTEVQVVHDTDGAILPLMEMIHRVTTEKGDRYHEIADCLLETICAYLVKYINKKSKYDFVDSFKNLIYENLSNCEFDVAEEIKKSGYSADHFRRCFKEETGATPLEYLTTLRINHAKKLIRTTPYQSIESIASGCGFADEFYFSRVFKKSTSLSPRQYRKASAN